MPVTLLLIGYGNPGRGDDGLGPALATAIQALDLPGVSVDIDYQLTVDHAALIAAHDLVVFADAMLALEEPYRFDPLGSFAPETLGSHQVTPEAALALAQLLFGKTPKAYVLAMSGRDFGEIKEGLSAKATANLALALDFLTGWLRAALPG